MMIYILILAAIALVFIIYNTYFVKINKYDVTSRVPDKFSFAHISDVHGTVRFLNGSLSSLINSLNVDFVVATGDLSNWQKQLPKVLKEFENIKAKSGVFIVPGNYECQEIVGLRKRDRSIDAEAELIQQTKNVILLKNQHYLLNNNNSTILVYGFDNSKYGREAYTFDIDYLKHDYKIILAHSPAIISYIEENNISYNQILAGHTHGGQIRLLKNWHLGEYRNFHTGMKSYGKGLFCISRGLGTTKIPLRFNCLPEISVYNVAPK